MWLEFWSNLQKHRGSAITETFLRHLCRAVPAELQNGDQQIPGHCYWEPEPNATLTTQERQLIRSSYANMQGPSHVMTGETIVLSHGGDDQGYLVQIAQRAQVSKQEFEVYCRDMKCAFGEQTLCMFLNGLTTHGGATGHTYA